MSVTVEPAFIAEAGACPVAYAGLDTTMLVGAFVFSVEVAQLEVFMETNLDF